MEQTLDGTILVVDDDDDICDYLKILLSSKGYHVFTSSSGEEAIAIAKASAPDLIILDIRMPNMDGYATCEELRNNEQTKLIPIIFVTAESKTDASVIRGLSLGGNDYITKPFNDNQLISRIESLIRTHSEYKLKIIDEKLKTLFEIISSLTHKINQPLTAVLGNAELMMRTLDEEDKNYQRAKIIFTSAQKITATMTHFRDIRYNEQKDYLNETVFLIDVNTPDQSDIPDQKDA